jgi:hypothetical protein
MNFMKRLIVRTKWRMSGVNEKLFFHAMLQRSTYDYLSHGIVIAFYSSNRLLLVSICSFQSF